MPARPRSRRAASFIRAGEVLEALVPRGPASTYWPEVLSLVAAGLGVSPVAARAAEHHARPGVAFVPFRDAPPVEYGLSKPRPSARRAPGSSS